MLSSESCTDVFIVGGGPAGLAAAIAARRKGFSVTVADGAAPPIEKPCGEGMMPETLAALRDLGVSLPPGDGHPFQGITFAQTGARVSADFSHGLGTGLRRTVLNQCLAARAEECGVCLLWQTPVVGMEGSEVRLSRGVIRASWIIGADGLGSRVRRWSNLDASTVFGQRYATRRHYRLKPWSNYAEVHWSRHAQAYITPIGSEEICVVMMAGNPQHASFESGLSEMPELKQKFEGAELCSRERGAVTATRSLRRIYRDNVALLGDASGGVDAITGEGLRMAFRQAFALADAMQARDLTQYQRAHRQLARRPRMMGSLLLWLGRNPRIRARAIRAMRHRPELFPRMLAAHVGHATPAQLVSTGVSLGWNFLAV